MDKNYEKRSHIPDFPLWDKLSKKLAPMTVEIELTARCNNNCRHCYINLPASDRKAQKEELSLGEICKIADEAMSMGTIWCQITGGEPLLRQDFIDIYTMLKKKGLLLSVFTNACLVNEKHVELFRKYPPRDIEVTVYGITRETYEKVTGKPGSYDAFQRGLNMLLEAGIKVRLKAMAIRSNVHELPEIAEFCRAHTKDYFRFDPLLHLRYDRNPVRNEMIKQERLSPEEIVSVEQADKERSEKLEEGCDRLMLSGEIPSSNQLFHCNAGYNSYTIGYNGVIRMCSSLWHPDTLYNLRKGSLEDAWFNFIPHVRNLSSTDPEFKEKCQACKLINFCLWCPAHSYLENGRMDAWCEYFCQVAHARVNAIKIK